MAATVLGFIAAVCAVFTVWLQYLTLPAENRPRVRIVVVGLLVGGSVFGLTLGIRTAYRGPSLPAVVRATQAVLLAGALHGVWSASRCRYVGRHAAGAAAQPERRRPGWRILQACGAALLILAALTVPDVARYFAVGSCDTHAFPDAVGKDPRVGATVSIPPTDYDALTYIGPISIIVKPEAGQTPTDYAVLLRWGQWRYCALKRDVAAAGVAFQTLKSGRDGTPLRVAVWPPAEVEVVKGPVEGALDINLEWVTWPEWLVV